MNFRPAQRQDVESMFLVRARTRENAFSREQLEPMGITAESVSEALVARRIVSFVCAAESGEVVGFCNGEPNTGEVLVLAVLPEYEGRGIGKRLLALVVKALREASCDRIWLAATSNAKARAYGFYRAQGWRPTGDALAHGDQVLVLDTESP